MDDGITKVEE